MVQQTNQWVAYPIKNSGLLEPKEGARIVPFYFDFSSQTTWDVDLQNAMSRDFISMAQTMWVDNTGNTGNLDIIFDVIKLHFQFAPGQQGFFPVTLIDPVRFSVTAAAGSAQISLINYAIRPVTWIVPAPAP